MFVAPLSPGWLAFERLQHTLPHRNADHANDEALAALAADLPTRDMTASQVNRRFRSLRMNRQRKGRARSVLLALHVNADRARYSNRVSNPATAADIADQLAILKGRTPPQVWRALERIAAGSTCAQTAAELGVTAESIRTAICRLRKSVRLRDQQTA